MFQSPTSFHEHHLSQPRSPSLRASNHRKIGRAVSSPFSSVKLTLSSCLRKLFTIFTLPHSVSPFLYTPIITIQASLSLSLLTASILFSSTQIRVWISFVSVKDFVVVDKVFLCCIWYCLCWWFDVKCCLSIFRLLVLFVSNLFLRLYAGFLLVLIIVINM